ncbi:MAG: HlyD family secretion protein [Fusobacterium sp.]|nr:HlyD family secretion protein [Fusobacterium sp.]
MTEEIEVKEENNKKKPPLWMVITIGIIVLGAVGYFVHDALRFQSTDDAYVETTTVSVAPKVSGEVVEVLVTDNQYVREGDVVARIDDVDYKIRLDQANAAYEKTLLNQKNAKATFNARQTDIDVAKKDLDRYKSLYEKGAVSKQTLDNAQAKYDSALAGHTSAEQGLFSDKKDRVADADLKSVKAQKDWAEQQLKYTEIVAPQSGFVTSRRVEKGMFAQVGSPLFVIVPDNVWVVANFKENQLTNMKEGQPVDIKIDTYPNKVFKGQIDSIQRSSGAKSSLFPPENAVGSFVKIVQRIPVKIVITEDYDREQYKVIPGMSVVPKVKVR